MNKTRNKYIDAIKGLGIILVVYAHNKSPLVKIIYSFHMPLFFVIAGIFFKKYNSYLDFFKKKFKELMKPYFIFSIPLYLFWLFITRHFGQMKVMDTPPLKVLLGVFIGASKVSSIEYGVPLWFLMCLFVVFNIYYFLQKIIYKNIDRGIVMILIIFLLDFKLKNIIKDYPLYIYTAFIALLFFFLGNILKELIIKLKPQLILFLISSFIFIILSKNNIEVSMLENKYGNIFLFYFTALFGIYSIFQLVKLLKLENSVIMSWLGKNTIPILCFHNVGKQLLKIIYKIFNFTYEENTIYVAFIYCIIELILCLPIIFLYNKLIKKGENS